MTDEKKKSIPEREEEILKFWEENGIFKQSLEKTKRGKKFVFYEGPPTANGSPGIHHVLARAFKDVIPRYKTMRGFFVPRRAGWDTHGLPVELQIEKKLGFKTKQDIENYGIAKFNAEAKKSVWEYKEEWERLTKRMGFWIDMHDPYITYDTTYIESLWWIIKEFWKNGLLEQDFKVMPWCTRCQTGLSSHEVGQGYQETIDTAVYVKFKLKLKPEQKIGGLVMDKPTYILSWTTTPWTLPGNVALAVGAHIDYRIAKKQNEYLLLSADYILGKHPLVFGDDAPIDFFQETIKGEDLVGLEYEPLFVVDGLKESGNSHRVYAAPFVSAKEGTSVVHTAVMYGEDDYRLGSEVGLPKYHTVTEDGKFVDGLGALSGLPVKDKETEEKIIEMLGGSLLYKNEEYKHDYPFCWRCNTPLLYYARRGWWVKTTKVKKELIANNETINWVPAHLKHGRFGEFLREVRDWAFSRERYWGTPLPIWKCDACENREVIGSRQELASHGKKLNNTYCVIRHGESETNLRGIISSDEEKYPLTMKGKLQIQRAAKILKKESIDMIISSPILRARHSAEEIARTLGIKKVHYDARLKEISFGAYEGKKEKEYHHAVSNMPDKFTYRIPGGESLEDVAQRMMAALMDLEKKHEGKKILLVGHDYPLWLLIRIAEGISGEDAVRLREGNKGKPVHCAHAEVYLVKFANVPRDEKGEINLHRPYVDDFVFSCKKCKCVMRRVPEVADVWFDSGAMPFAAYATTNHQPPTTNKKIPFPADYICEAVDQTRGWFYTLLNVATLLGKKSPYRNVISLGHILDKNGQKMSKSKGNIVNPWDMIGKYGIDALRWYFYTASAPGDPKKFDERDLANKYRGFVMTFWNSFVLFNTYVEKTRAGMPKIDELKLSDRWILSRLDEVTTIVTDALDGYDITSAGRALEELVVGDFSQWYLRRSRRALQHPENKKDYEITAQIAGNMLLRLAILCAPFIPFVSEMIYQELRKKMRLKTVSIHLCDWPKTDKRFIKKDLERDMALVRQICSEVLKLRADAGIKVRQPLQELRIRNRELRKKPALLDLIKDELNVKEISFGKEMWLDTAITPELREEGMVRELTRNIQELRRDLGLKPQQIIHCQIMADPAMDEIIVRWQKQIQKDIHARTLKIGGKKKFKAEREINLDGKKVWVGIKK